MSKFATLMETSGEDCESWYYFIKYEGNEKNLKKIKSSLEEVIDYSMVDGLNIFDIDIENLVSEQTAFDMCMLELNSVTYHRKFDGVLKEISFDFVETDDDVDKMTKISDVLENGNIEEFIDQEYIPESHIMSDDEISDSSSDDEPDVKEIDESKLPSSFKNLNLK